MSESSVSSATGSPSTPASSLLGSPNLESLSIKEVSDEDKAASAEFKNQANKAFSGNDFADAAALYTKAIELNPSDATLYCNRAYARMKLEENGYAMADATLAISLNPTYVKAYYRRALCQLSILKPQLAVPDFKMVLKLDPTNKLARGQLDATNKLIKRMQFEAAIDMGEEKSTIHRCYEIITDGGCEVDKNYTGPKLDEIPPAADSTTATTNKPKYKITPAFIEEMIEYFKSGKCVHRRIAWEIILGCNEALAKEKSLVDVSLEEGVTCDVIGDTHGQFYDLLHLLELTGKPSETHCLLFNGDFVDRGSWSVEVVLTLFAYKWLYPHRVFLNRGNHETKDMNKVYGFEGEVKHKLGELTYKLFSDVFTTLPLSTLVSASQPPDGKSDSSNKSSKPPILSPNGLKRYFVVHGGLFSKDDVSLDEIRKIDRFGHQPGQDGLMCELLWTDPQELPGRGPSKRGVGIGFGPDVTRRWCEFNGVTGVLRSHEVRQGGYAIEHDGLCTTVFSAPNYCDSQGNLGAFVRIDSQGSLSYTTFEARPHPPMRPMAYSNSGLGMM